MKEMQVCFCFDVKKSRIEICDICTKEEELPDNLSKILKLKFSLCLSKRKIYLSLDKIYLVVVIKDF